MVYDFILLEVIPLDLVLIPSRFLRVHLYTTQVIQVLHLFKHTENEHHNTASQ
jgi:hypothetical protein